MSENQQESNEEITTGISDDQLPEDLVPSEDNPLAEGLPPEEANRDLLTEGKHAEDEEGKQPDTEESATDASDDDDEDQ